MFVIVNSVVPYITIIYPFQDLENQKKLINVKSYLLSVTSILTLTLLK